MSLGTDHNEFLNYIDMNLDQIKGAVSVISSDPQSNVQFTTVPLKSLSF